MSTHIIDDSHETQPTTARELIEQIGERRKEQAEEMLMKLSRLNLKAALETPLDHEQALFLESLMHSWSIDRARLDTFAGIVNFLQSVPRGSNVTNRGATNEQLEQYYDSGQLG